MLAIGYTNEDTFDSGWKIFNLLSECRQCIGSTFQGYKGGYYKMDEHTEVWIDNYGHASSTGLVEIIDAGYKIILRADYREY